MIRLIVFLCVTLCIAQSSHAMMAPRVTAAICAACGKLMKETPPRAGTLTNRLAAFAVKQASEISRLPKETHLQKAETSTHSTPLTISSEQPHPVTGMVGR